MKDLIALWLNFCFLGTKGKEFLIGLLQQTALDKPTIQVASDVLTSMTIEAPFVGMSKTYLIPAGITEIELDLSLRETSPAISFKGIHIKAIDPISIHIVDSSIPNMGGFNVLPLEALSTEYMVMSYKRKTSSEFLIISSSDRNRVSVTLKTKGNVTHNGLVYTDGEIFHEHLDTFQTWQISSNFDLTGTFIKAEGKIAVFSGSECTAIPDTSSKCDFLDEQVPTVTSWETSFIVPLVDECYNVVRILGRDDGTNVTLKHGQTKSIINLDSAEYVDKIYRVVDNRDPVVVVQSTRPVLIAHFTGVNESNPNCGPSMTIVPASNQFTDKYDLISKSNLDASFVKIIIGTDKLGGLLMNNQTITPLNRYDVLIGRLKDSVAVFDLKLPIHKNDTPVSIFHDSGIDFGAIFYGFKQHQGLSFPLGMKMDLSQGKQLMSLKPTKCH